MLMSKIKPTALFVGSQIIVDSNDFAVSLQETKNYLKIISNDDDSFISTCIKSAQKKIESYCQISLVEKTYAAFYENIQANATVYLPYPRHLQFINLYDKSGNIVDVSNYEVKKTGHNWRLTFLFDDCKTYEARFISGYSTQSTYYNYATDLNDDLKIALLRLVAFYYEKRGIGADTDERKNSIPNEIYSILLNYFAKNWF